MMSRFLLCFIAVSVASVSAITKEEMNKVYKELVRPHILECAKEFTVTEGQIKEAKDKKDIDGISPCFYSCVFKGIGAIDDKGTFKPEVMVELGKKYFASEDDQKNIAELTNLCSEVNDADVSDECDRAKLLLKCGLKNKILLFAQ